MTVANESNSIDQFSLPCQRERERESMKKNGFTQGNKLTNDRQVIDHSYAFDVPIVVCCFGIFNESIVLKESEMKARAAH
jgi:hypothetical protein